MPQCGLDTVDTITNRLAPFSNKQIDWTAEDSTPKSLATLVDLVMPQAVTGQTFSHSHTVVDCQDPLLL